jgi:hypothetical protein
MINILYLGAHGHERRGSDMLMSDVRSIKLFAEEASCV